MEVAQRTAADRKGGHLAQTEDGHLLLRESAQCPPEEESQFQDIHLYRFFNTNNLWIHLPALARLVEKRHGVLGLPLIRNEKPVDPADPTTPRVFQLETAMGAALGVIRGAQALLVPRSRFVPVKKNSDLLVLTSDAYLLDEGFTLQLAAERGAVPPIVAAGRSLLCVDRPDERALSHRRALAAPVRRAARDGRCSLWETCRRRRKRCAVSRRRTNLWTSPMENGAAGLASLPAGATVANSRGRGILVEPVRCEHS